MSYKYILIDINNNQLDGYYLTFPQTSYLLKKHKAYIFRFKSDKHILYLNDKIEHYYSSSRINKVDDNNKEEDITTYSYVEVRITDKFPSIRTGVLNI